MKSTKLFFILNLLLLCALVTGCSRNRDDIWEDSKSAGRHMGRGFRALGGKHGESRQVQSGSEFDPCDDASCYAANKDFIPLLNDEFPNEIAMSEFHNMQPSESPGDPGSSIPGIEAFFDPSNESGLAQIFQHIHFPYDSNLLKGRENFMIVERVADFLKKNPNQYIFVEGHCDERGSEAYNFALGSRRANTVRNLLITEGVDPDRVFTISYGKDRPLSLDTSDDSWSVNRRAQFKMWQRG